MSQFVLISISSHFMFRCMLIRIVLSQILLSSIILLSFNSCDDTFTAADIDSRIIPDSNVRFSEHLAPVFNLKCNSCHGNGTTEASLDLTNPSLFVDGIIVVPEIPETSILVWRIDPTYGANPMPPIDAPYEPFNENQIQGVKTWIKEGAINN